MWDSNPRNKLELKSSALDRSANLTKGGVN